MLNILFIGDRLNQAKENGDFLLEEYKCQIKSYEVVSADIDTILKRLSRKKYDLIFTDPISGGYNSASQCFDLIDKIQKDSIGKGFLVFFYSDIKAKANISFTGVYHRFHSFFWHQRFNEDKSLEKILDSQVRNKLKRSSFFSRIQHFFDLTCPSKKARASKVIGGILLAFLAPYAGILVYNWTHHVYHDEREIANERYLELMDFEHREDALKLQSQIQDLSKLSAELVKTEQNRWSYSLGLLFTPEDVLVARSFEKKGWWIVAIDLLDSKEEEKQKADEKIRKILQRMQPFEYVEENGVNGNVKIFVGQIGDLIKYFEGKESKVYQVTDYDIMYNADLKTKYLDK